MAPAGVSARVAFQASNEAAPGWPLASSAHSPGRRVMPKILLVEDNEMNRDMLSRRLVRGGYEVIIAEDGARGVAMATNDRPDLILMDMSLPVIDGWEATRRIKATPELRKIPIIALTAHAMATDRERALEAGCDDYDTKPIELQRLLGKVETLLAAAGQ
jgi:CheY-like chemotaxis protein